MGEEIECVKNNYRVYMHKCIINNLIYYGITGLPKLVNRWGSKGGGYRDNPKFWNDIVKFGWINGFIHEVLFENLTLKEALKIESQLIIRDKTYLPEFGYNRNKGGSRGFPRTIEHIEKMRLNSPTKKSVVCLNTGEVFYSIHEAGRKMDISFKLISAVCNNTKKSAKGFKFCFSENYDPDIEYDLRYGTDLCSKPVICLETLNIFSSIQEASEKLNINCRSLSSVCNNSRKTCGGLHFCFIENYDPNKKYDLSSSSNKRKIICLTTGQTFNSIADAGRSLNIRKNFWTHISDVCKGKMNQTQGYKFCYAEDYYNGMQNEKIYRKNCKKVICIETGKIFNSIQECAIQLNLNQSKVGAVCNHKRKTTGGLHFEFYIDKN